jgi:hypothetical protein
VISYYPHGSISIDDVLLSLLLELQRPSAGEFFIEIDPANDVL